MTEQGHMCMFLVTAAALELPQQCFHGGKSAHLVLKEQEGPEYLRWVWMPSRRERAGFRQTGSQHVDIQINFLSLVQLDTGLETVEQDVPSCFISHNAFISATEPKLLFACFLPPSHP